MTACPFIAVTVKVNFHKSTFIEIAIEFQTFTKGFFCQLIKICFFYKLSKIMIIIYTSLWRNIVPTLFLLVVIALSG